jgi:hypothetical protein
LAASVDLVKIYTEFSFSLWSPHQSVPKTTG